MTNTQAPNVIIYSTTWCGFCRSEKQYLDSKNISYSDKNIEEDETAYNELMEKIGGRQNFAGVPVTDINGEIILGFDRPRINKALDIS